MGRPGRPKKNSEVSAGMQAVRRKPTPKKNLLGLIGLGAPSSKVTPPK